MKDQFHFVTKVPAAKYATAVLITVLQNRKITRPTIMTGQITVKPAFKKRRFRLVKMNCHEGCPMPVKVMISRSEMENSIYLL